MSFRHIVGGEVGYIGVGVAIYTTSGRYDVEGRSRDTYINHYFEFKFKMRTESKGGEQGSVHLSS